MNRHPNTHCPNCDRTYPTRYEWAHHGCEDIHKAAIVREARRLRDRLRREVLPLADIGVADIQALRAHPTTSGILDMLDMLSKHKERR
jgi:hypothetical protein